MWTLTKCISVTEDVRCSSGRVFNTVQTRCSGGETSNICCHNQFFIRDGVIEAYRPTGRCRTDCTTRPGGAC